MACLFLLLLFPELPPSVALLTSKCQIAEGWLKPHTAETLSLCPSALDTGLVVFCSNVTSLPGDLAPVPVQVSALCVSGSISILHEGAFLSFPELRYLSIIIKMSVISPRAFRGLSKLQHLSIHHSDVGCTKLSPIPSQVFQPLYHLQALDIKGFYLTGQGEIALPGTLQSLSVSSCCMEHFSELLSIFPSLKSIPHLTVKDCEMESLPYSVSPRQRSNYPVLSLPASWFWKERVNLKVQNGSLLQTLSLSHIPLAFSELMTLKTDKTDYLSLDNINLLHENQTCPISILVAQFTLRSLTFSQNYYPKFVCEDLPVCHSLKSLVLDGNKLEHVDSLLLYKFPSLQLLNLSRNHLHWNLCPAMYLTMNFTSRLQVLDFSGNNGKSLPASAFSCLPYLQELSLNRCGLKKIDPLSFSGFNNIKVLNLKGNNIKYLHSDSFSNLPFLTSLDLSDNDIEYFGHSAFQNLALLRELEIGSYDILPEVSFSVPNVASFGLKSASLTIFHSVVTTAFASVQNMSLSGCYNFQNAKNHSFFPSVQRLHWEPALHECQSSRPFHQHFPLLEQFIYKYNIDGLFSSKLFNFSHLSRLRILEVHNLPEDDYSPKEAQYYFMDLPSLEVLKVVNSNIRFLSAVFFHRKSNLRLLVLEKEEFLALDNDIQDQIEVHPHYIHFSNVTFRCDCSSAWIIDWATRKRGVYVSGLDQADCLDVIWRRNKQKFVPFIEQNCSQNAGFLLFIVTFSFMSLLISLILLYATCGSDFVFLVYMVRAWWKGLLDHNKDQRFEYDAFVSYSSQDQGWVLQNLVPNLEQNGPPFLKLCLHNRDFVVGKAIVDNIMESLYSSRKTICVVSCNALGSHWCSLEMSLATYRLMAEQDDTLIVLFVEHVPRHQLSAYHRLAKLVKRKTYLEWPKEPTAQTVFWDKLRGILGQQKASGQKTL